MDFEPWQTAEYQRLFLHSGTEAHLTAMGLLCPSCVACENLWASPWNVPFGRLFHDHFYHWFCLVLSGAGPALEHGLSSDRRTGRTEWLSRGSPGTSDPWPCDDGTFRHRAKSSYQTVPMALVCTVHYGLGDVLPWKYVADARSGLTALSLSETAVFASGLKPCVGTVTSVEMGTVFFGFLYACLVESVWIRRNPLHLSIYEVPASAWGLYRRITSHPFPRPSVSSFSRFSPFFPMGLWSYLYDHSTDCLLEGRETDPCVRPLHSPWSFGFVRDTSSADHVDGHCFCHLTFLRLLPRSGMGSKQAHPNEPEVHAESLDSVWSGLSVLYSLSESGQGHLPTEG
ncbi:MAG: hypothetical protein ACOYIG_12730 [Acetivibrionales bacterium]